MLDLIKILAISLLIMITNSNLVRSNDMYFSFPSGGENLICCSASDGNGNQASKLLENNWR